MMALWILAGGIGAAVGLVRGSKGFWLAAGSAAAIAGLTLPLLVGWAWAIGCAALTVLWACLFRYVAPVSPNWTIGVWAVLFGLGALVLLFSFDSGMSASYSVAFAWVGALGLIGTPANNLCRAVLQRQSSAPREESTGGLRGGRIIGPLERLLLTILGLTGATSVVVAIIAAKGIVRFPEISADKEDGSKAEEFLIGSFVSWGIAALLTLGLRAVV